MGSSTLLDLDQAQVLLNELFLRTERLKPRETILAKSWINNLIIDAINGVNSLQNPVSPFNNVFLQGSKFIIVDSLNMAFNDCWDHLIDVLWTGEFITNEFERDLAEDYHLFFFPYFSKKNRKSSNKNNYWTRSTIIEFGTIQQINFVIEVMFLLSKFGKDGNNYLLVHKIHDHSETPEVYEGFFQSRFPNIWVAVVKDSSWKGESDDLLLITWTILLEKLGKTVSILSSDNYKWAKFDPELNQFIQEHKVWFELKGDQFNSKVTDIQPHFQVCPGWRTRILGISRF